MTKRIEYIDALRGFTMILVVAVHVYSLCFMQGNAKEYDLSINNLFGLFRMPLFFFISGFVFFKIGRNWNLGLVTNFITSKIRVQLLSTSIFLILYCIVFQKNITHALYDTAKEGYWFTISLFMYFILYIGIDWFICTILRKPAFNNFTITTSITIGLGLYYLTNNGYLLNLFSPQTTGLLSINKVQYFIFFSLGCFTHKYYNYFLKPKRSDYFGVLIVAFTCISFCFFIQNNIGHIFIKNYILKLFAAVLGITIVMITFKTNEIYFLRSTKIGFYLQIIGKHTLDIYFLHYLFLPYNLSSIGRWFKNNPNPLFEFFASFALAIIVVVTCLIVSRILRQSSVLSYLLFGGKKD